MLKLLNPLNLEQKKTFWQAVVFFLFYWLLAAIIFSILQTISIYTINVYNFSKIPFYIIFIAKILYVPILGIIILHKKKLTKSIKYNLMLFVLLILLIFDPKIFILGLIPISFLTTRKKENN